MKTAQNNAGRVGKRQADKKGVWTKKEFLGFALAGAAGMGLPWLVFKKNFLLAMSAAAMWLLSSAVMWFLTQRSHRPHA
jgi:hypothetical protein